ncbi:MULTISPECIES: hemerythrin domain-containing protein [Sphingomonas]|jgi:hypothetical protein|uniref:hemerythrin domain-containing protein n=1 Tax=Sphingomonas TaxID=13687 RepID=UPI001AEDFE3E|nr:MULTISPECIES: hemerythrin domain-containing protein [Sphingomonas]
MPQIDIALLKRQHADIVVAVDALIALTRQPQATALPQLGATRVRLAQLLRDHRLAEEAQVHAPLRAARRIDAIPGYASILEDARRLRGVYSAHLNRWSAAEIAKAWAEYGQEVPTHRAALLAMFKREEAELYPAAARLLQG